MNKAFAAATLAAAFALAACGRGGDKNELTPEENAQLANASEMLDTSPDSMAVEDNEAVGNGEVADDDMVDETTGANSASAPTNAQ